MAGAAAHGKAVTPLIEYDREVDGRWIAEIPAIPGCLAYGSTQEEARDAVLALAREIEREGHLTVLRQWFSAPPRVEPDFAGCVVYRSKRGERCGLLARATDRLLWDRGVRQTMPFCSQPDASWEGAEPVGFAATYEEAVALMEEPAASTSSAR